MGDQILAVAVVLLPTLFAVGIEGVSKEIKQHPYWRRIVFTFGIGLSVLTWFQMSRANKTATIDRQNAIVETSKRVSAASPFLKGRVVSTKP
jgi:arginine exporter protein ArgO